MLKHFKLFASAVLTLGLCSFLATGAAAQSFQLHSPAFQNNGTIPLSAVLNNPTNGVNSCTATGAAGGDQSPALYWTGVPWGTQSYVVMLYDVTAGFTHWGIYNINGWANGLPANAGVAGSSYGTQIMNDFYLGDEYDGPCPPNGVAPDAHQYVFSVYALSSRLYVPGTTNFVANSEGLFHALVQAGAKGQILGTASLTGYFSSTPGSGNNN